MYLVLCGETASYSISHFEGRGKFENCVDIADIHSDFAHAIARSTFTRNVDAVQAEIGRTPPRMPKRVIPGRESFACAKSPYLFNEFVTFRRKGKTDSGPSRRQVDVSVKRWHKPHIF